MRAFDLFRPGAAVEIEQAIAVVEAHFLRILVLSRAQHVGSASASCPRKEFLPMPMDFDMPNVRRFRPRPVSGLTVFRLLAILIAAILVFTTWFTIEPEEAGIVLRFGRFARQVQSGLHMKL